MAELLGIGLYSLNKIENGVLPPNMTVDVIFMIWKHFGISPKNQLVRRLGEEKAP